MMKRFGFTLAEVLITLGIIGVVAAMTMPTLINKTNGAQYKAAFKKSLSALSQAATLNDALDGWNFDDIQNSLSIDHENGGGGIIELDTDYSLEKLLKNRMHVVKTTNRGDLWDFTINEVDNYDSSWGNKYGSGEILTCLHFADGIALIYDAGSFEYTGMAMVDVNGEKGPNKEVACDEPYTSEDDSCTVSHPTDMYPIKLTGKYALPLSPAAKAIMYGK